MILHTVNRSPFSHQTLDNCLKRMSSNDALLLIEDGVYGLLAHNPYQLPLRQLVRCYALDEDVTARGLHKLNSDQRIESIHTIHYSGFVELACEFSRTISWY
ncbi:sulfurtransferase complex subunit TusB [bacterium]|nr:sulfurtransferase complex subunit TusB [bacterium]